MGFSIFGNSGSSSSSSTSVTKNEQTTSTPQLNFAGAGPAAGALVVNPTLTDSSITGGITTNSTTYYAPITFTPSTNYGDSAVASAQQTAQQATNDSTSSGSGGILATLQGLFSGSNLYWILGALVVIMYARGHHK